MSSYLSSLLPTLPECDDTRAQKSLQNTTATDNPGTEAGMSGADKGDEFGSQALPTTLPDGTQPSSRSEKVKLEPEVQENQSQEHTLQQPQHQQQIHKNIQHYQHYQQNSSTALNSLEEELERERNLRVNAEYQAKLGTQPLRSCRKQLRRQRRKHKKFLKRMLSNQNRLQSEIETLQARLGIAEKERDDAWATMITLEKSSEETNRKLIWEKERSRMAMDANYKSQDRLGETEAVLCQERERLGDVVADYDEISNLLNENEVALGRERELREAAEKRNSQWKKDYTELAEQIKAERQVAHDKLTDEYLIAEVQKLDFNIKKFAQLYFGDADPRNAAFSFNVRVATSEADVDQMMVLRTVPGHCVRVAQARLWSILVRTVFGGYIWCLDLGESSLGQAINSAETAMEQLMKRSDPDNTQLEVRQAFHSWRAQATSHCLKSSSTEDGAASSSDELDSSLLNAVSAWLEPQRRRSMDQAAFAQGLGRILVQSVKMDKEISRQPSDVKWLLPAMSANLGFDPESMDLVDREVMEQSRRTVLLCVSPCLLRRGTCSGGGFENERVLRRMCVSGSAVMSAHGLGQGLRLGGSIETEI